MDSIGTIVGCAVRAARDVGAEGPRARRDGSAPPSAWDSTRPPATSCPRPRKSLRAAWVERYRHHWLDNSREPAVLFPGVTPMLETLLSGAGYWLAVATGKNRRGLDRELADDRTRPLLSRHPHRQRSAEQAAPGDAGRPAGRAGSRPPRGADGGRHQLRPRHGEKRRGRRGRGADRLARARPACSAAGRSAASSRRRTCRTGWFAARPESRHGRTAPGRALLRHRRRRRRAGRNGGRLGGWRGVGAFDINEKAVAVYRHNFPGHPAEVRLVDTLPAARLAALEADLSGFRRPASPTPGAATSATSRTRAPPPFWPRCG